MSMSFSRRWCGPALGLALAVLACSFAAAGDAPPALQTEPYPIDDLLPCGDAGSWAKLIATIVAPETWQQAGGRGSILAIPPAAPHTLLVEQSRGVHRRIAELLQRVRRPIREAAAGRVEVVCGHIGLTAGEAKIIRALQSPTQLEFVETPLKDVLDYLKDYHRIEIRLDYPALEKAKLHGDELVTKILKGTSLAAGLRLMLRALTPLCPVVGDDALTITTREAAKDRPSVRMYSVEDIVEAREVAGNQELQPDGLVRAITSTVAPESWHGAGGNGTIGAITRGPARSLVAYQTEEVHAEIADLLARLRRLARKEPLHSPAERKLAEALDSPTVIEFTETPLQDVVDYLKDVHHVEIQVDVQTLEAAQIGSDTLITANEKEMKLRSALRLLLPSELTYIIRDEVVVITTLADADSDRNRVTRIYPLADLLAGAAAGANAASAEQIVKVITAGIAPERWRGAGGKGYIAPYLDGRGKCLIVSQSWTVHEQVADLLAVLRLIGATAAPAGETGGAPPAEVAAPLGAQDSFRAALAAPTSADVKNAPLIDAVEFLVGRHQAKVRVERGELRRQGISVYSPISGTWNAVPLRSVLSEMLGNAKLGFIVCGDVLLITTPEEGRRPYTVVYPLDEQAAERIAGLGHAADAGRVIEHAAAAILPKTWQSAGGEGTIAALPRGTAVALVVTQTGEVHQRLADLLHHPGICVGASLPGSLGELLAQPPAASPPNRRVPAGAGQKPAEKPRAGRVEAPPARPAKPEEDPFG